MKTATKTLPVVKPASPAKDAAQVLASTLNASAAQVASMTPTPDGDTMAAAVKEAFLQAFNECVAPSQERDKARDDAKDADAAADSAKERILANAAALSAKRKFTADQIDSVKRADLIAEWAKGRNYTPGSMGQFATEVARAMHPSARERVVDALAESRTLWEAERAQAKVDRDAKRETSEPLKDAFKKRYQMVFGSTGILAAHVKADALTPKGEQKHPDMTHEIAADPHTLADVNAGRQAVDPKRALSVVTRAMESLNAIVGVFPCPHIQAAIRQLAEIDVDALKAAHKQGERDAKVQASVQAAPPKPATPPKPAPAKPAPSAAEVSEASDALLALQEADPAVLAMLAKLLQRK